ncbi:MAG: pyruvate formate lyase family protein [Eubacteriales bacterium]|nr:pyruvate formate lyase family protein [Eubacteriales bacterium]
MRAKRTVTKRIQVLKENRKKYASKSEIAVRDNAYREAIRQHPEASVEEQHAFGFANTLMRKKILIPEDDLLAGYLFQYSYNVNFPMIVSEDFDPADRAKFQMDMDREIRETKELCDDDPAAMKELDEFADAVEVWLIKHWHSGHTLAGYEMLLQNGFEGLRQRVLQQQEFCESDREKMTIRAFLTVLDACVGYVRRYRLETERQIACADTEEDVYQDGFGNRKNCLMRMRKALKNIETKAPESFYEALQLLMLANEMMYCENIPSGISLGRIDQYLYSFYKRDVECGVLSYEEAGMLLETFWLKCSCQKKAYQNLTLGGCDASGKCSVNDLTYLCLESASGLRVDQPSVNFRWTDDMPEEAWQAVLELIRTGMGFPALLYDPCCMKAQMRDGISEEDVWNYGFVGCVEMAVAGKENALTEAARLNLPKLLNLMLRNGKDLCNKKTFEMKHKEAVSSIKTYDDLERMYLEEVEDWVRRILRNLNRIGAMYASKYPLPYLSVLTEDCISLKKDVMSGGARYSSMGFNLCGVATAVDSLAAIREVVFEKQMITLEEFVNVLEQDFEGNEQFYRFVNSRTMKYGNDRDIDLLAAKIETLVSDILKEYRNYWGGPYRLGLYSVEDHAIMGMHTGATADGRKCGESLSNSSGASQGKDVHGPTALINSVTKFPMELSGNGMVLDVKFTPSLLDEETGSLALRSVIETYFRKGGMEVQISVVSGETLRAAQKKPEDYADLIVRVSGFSAYFCSLRKATQDEIIKRTEHTM